MSVDVPPLLAHDTRDVLGRALLIVASMCARLILGAAYVAASIPGSAFGQTFTDDPLTTGTPVRAVHISEIRFAVTMLRAHLGLPLVVFTDPALTPGVTVVRAAHLTELRTAVTASYNAAGETPPTYTDATLGGVPIRAVHITELRTAIRSLVMTTGACVTEGSGLVNGALQCGAISGAGQIDVWTFSATAGDRIGLHIGETSDGNDFRPWLRLISPATVELSSTSGTEATAIDGVVAPVSGSYTVLVGSFDSGLDGTGTYRLSMARTPGPITVGPGDHGGGPLTNGATDTGTIAQGDLDVWTFTASAGDLIAVHAGQLAETDDFRPWVRLWAPNGAVLANTSGIDAIAIDGAVAPVTGTYLVLVASFDSGFDGEGSYRLIRASTPGPITVRPDDEGGPLTNGAVHTGEITQGDLDAWSITIAAGERFTVHLGELLETDDFRPWLRVWAPNGVAIANTSGTDATAVDALVAPVTGTYLVLVSSFDSGGDGEGTYRLTIARTGVSITVSPGDEGGPLTNGAMHTGDIADGDLDIWTFTATAGDLIGVNTGQTAEADDFRPWLRLWAPNGAVLANISGVDAVAIDAAVAPVSGTYFVLVASFDSGFDGEGSYRLTMTNTPGPVTVSPGDQGGPLTNGSAALGEILEGDLDVWTFTATAGDRIGVHVGQTIDADDFRPWLRVWAPNGVALSNVSGAEATVTDGVVAPVTGTYLVLIASFDTGLDGIGSYRLEYTRTPGPVAIAAGDQGGSVLSNTTHAGSIVLGDVDVWTITVTAGHQIQATATETLEVDDFRPWVRIWAPNGAPLGSNSNITQATVTVAVAPVTGTYLVLVSSFDSGFNGVGTYQVVINAGLVTPP